MNSGPSDIPSQPIGPVKNNSSLSSCASIAPVSSPVKCSRAVDIKSRFDTVRKASDWPSCRDGGIQQCETTCYLAA